MKNFKALILVGILAVGGSAMAAQSNLAKQLQSIYQKLDDLKMKKDFPSLSKYMDKISTADCVFVSKGSEKSAPTTQTRDVVLTKIGQGLPHIASITAATSHVEQVTPGPNSLVAIVSTSMVITTKSDKRGPGHAFTQKSSTQDTWVKVGGAWKLKSSKILSQAIAQDGKQVSAK